MTPESSPVTRLLALARTGDRPAVSELFRTVHSKLRAIAANLMTNERPGHVLQPTALVNELYLRLFRGEQLSVEASAEFYRLAARVMRHVLIDESRRRDAARRSGVTVELKDYHAVTTVNADQAALLCLALKKLSKRDARAAKIADLHYFSGRGVDEIAQMLALNERTIQRDLKTARVWLKRELSSQAHVTGAVGKG